MLEIHDEWRMGLGKAGVQSEPSPPPLGMSVCQRSWTTKRDEEGQNAADDSKTEVTDRQFCNPNDDVFKKVWDDDKIRQDARPVAQ